MSAQEKMLHMQMQIKENATELSDYLHDLDNWEKDIKEQDKTFTRMKPKKEQKIFAPVRSTMTAKKFKQKRNTIEKAKRIKSYDFQSWERLDVDKMMSEMDARDEEEETSKLMKKQQEMEMNMKKCSMEEKDKGNNHFKDGRYDQAIQCYTKGMQCDPSNPVLPANRAMAYLKLNKYVESEADCTLSLSLDPGYVKAYLRRGASRCALGKMASAIRDFNDVLKLEPDNKHARNELERVKKQTMTPTSKAVDREDKEIYQTKRSRFIQPISKPEHLRSQKPLRRIAVHEVGGNIDIENNKDCRKIISIGDHCTYAEPDSQTENATISRSATQIRKTNNLVEAIDAIKEKDDTVFNKPISKSAMHSKRKGPPEVLLSETNNLVIPVVPTTSFQFIADVRKLKDSPSSLFLYLSQLIPATLPILLKDQLDTDLLLNIVNSFSICLKKNETFIVEFLHQLSKSRRFDMAVMFLSSPNKKWLRLLFEDIAERLPDKADQMKTLSTVYRL